MLASRARVQALRVLQISNVAAESSPVEIESIISTFTAPPASCHILTCHYDGKGAFVPSYDGLSRDIADRRRTMTLLPP
jgi:hypothetical protein